MMRWLAANATWLFSGVGVAVVSLIGTAIYRRYFLWDRGNAPWSLQNHLTNTQVAATKNSVAVGAVVATGSHITQNITHVLHAAPPPPPEGIRTLTKYPSKPSPAEIWQDIDSVPAYQRKGKREAYVGLPVCWVAGFRNISEVSQIAMMAGLAKGTHTLMLGTDDHFGAFAIITTQIDIEKYPQFKTMHDKTPMRICGIIENVEHGIP